MAKRIERVEFEGIDSRHLPKSPEAIAILFLAHHVRRDVANIPPPPGAPPGSREDFGETIKLFGKFVEGTSNRLPEPMGWIRIILFSIAKFFDGIFDRVTEILRNLTTILALAFLLVILMLVLLGVEIPKPTVTFN